jgi:Nuclease-related domain
VALSAGSVFVIAGATFWSFEPRQTAVALLLGGAGLLAFAMFALCAWLWRAMRSSARPWGRLLVLSIVVGGLVNMVALEQHQLAWLPVLNGLEWALAIGLLLRLSWLGTRRAPEAETARWAAGATGEQIVSDALAQLGSDHVVIHNLPIPGRGDADHVVVGPAGVVVIETKYLAGRIICQGDGAWLQLKRDEVRQIADPSAQVQRAADGVAGRLRSHGLGNVLVRSVLVMAHPRAELGVSRSSVPVVRPFELVPVLRQLAWDEEQLDAGIVADAANALMDTRRRSSGRHWTASARGQALVELACGLSVILLLVFGLLGVARVTTALLGLTAVTREAARMGARAPDAATAFDWAVARGQQVAAEYGLGGVLLDVDTSAFEMQSGPGVLVPGEIRVRADATVDLSNVPLVAWAQVQVPLERRFAELVDPYRSAPPPAGGGQ